MKKLLIGLMVIANFAMPAHAHAQSGLSGTQGLVLGGALGFVTGRLMAPQAVIIQPGNYQIISIPMVPNLTAPRVYNLRGGPPHPDARPLYQEGTEYEPTCDCYVKFFNQIGWQ